MVVPVFKEEIPQMYKVEKNNENYDMYYVNPDNKSGFESVGYIFAHPKELQDEEIKMILHPVIKTQYIEEDCQTQIKEEFGDLKGPIIMPVLPNYDMGYIELSEQCFTKDSDINRIDLQIINILKDAQNRIKNITNKEISRKLFLSGTDKLGIFAMRFAGILNSNEDQPFKPETVCVKNIKTDDIPYQNGMKSRYPEGIRNFGKLVETQFNESLYKETKLIILGNGILDEKTPRISKYKNLTSKFPDGSTELSFGRGYIDNTIYDKLSFSDKFADFMRKMLNKPMPLLLSSGNEIEDEKVYKNPDEKFGELPLDDKEQVEKNIEEIYANTGISTANIATDRLRKAINNNRIIDGRITIANKYLDK